MTIRPNFAGRISVRHTDSGYELWRSYRAHGMRPTVYFNGEHATGVITADTEAGTLVRLKNPIEYDTERQQCVDEVVHGRVEVEMHPESML